MQIIEVPLQDLKEAEYNPRQMTEKQVKDLTESIKRFGLVDPIIVNSHKGRENVVVGGHQRLKIAFILGLTTIPVVYVNLDEKKERELNLRLNRNLGEWDYNMLANFNEEELLNVGFTSEELDKMFNLEEDEDIFDIQFEYEKLKQPISKLGDLYQLENHRLLCGDATKKEDVERLMNGEKADMVFTDPPYNVDYSGRGKKTSNKIMMDNQSQEDFIEFSEKFIKNIKDFTKNGATFYICSGWSSYATFVYALRKNGLYFSQPLIWIKNVASMGWNDYRYKHEQVIKVKNKVRKNQPILYGWNEGKHYFISERDETDVWEVKRRASNTMIHPTQKPLELIGRAIRNSSKRGEIILDLFGGSGSSLISAEREGRIAYLNELDPKFVDVAIKRWEQYTNNKAVKL